MKKYIIILLIVNITLTSLYSNLSDNVDTLYNVALNKNINSLNAQNSLESAIDDLDENPLIYSTSIKVDSNVNYANSSTSSLSQLSIDVPLYDQLSFNAKIDTNLDGDLGFIYSPLEISATNVYKQVEYENSSLYLNEYKENLNVEIAQAYLDYLLAKENVKIQETRVDLYKLIYEETLSLYKYEESTLSEVQNVLLDYNDSKNMLSDYQLDVYAKKIILIELMGIENFESLVIPEADINEIVDLCDELNTVLKDKDFSPMMDYEVVESLNTKITLQDSFDTMKWYDPTLNISGNISTDGEITGVLSFSTSFDDFNKEEKESLLDDIALAEANANSKIYKIQNEIDVLEKTLISDKEQIDSIKKQIENNNYVINEASDLLQLGEYEVLDYQSLLINENTLKLSLLETYANLYVDQLTLINYL